MLINQYGPGSGAPTGRLLGELASFLEENGHQVGWLATDPVYGSPKPGWRRWLHELNVHALLLFRGLTYPAVDAVISFTSPVCLVVTARMVACFHHAQSWNWAMDLYPDLAVALREIKPGLLEAFLHRLMKISYHGAGGVVALDDDMRAYLEKVYSVKAAVVPPWPESAIENELSLADSRMPGPRWQWMYSGNLGRAHEWEILALAQLELEKRGLPVWLVVQGGGASLELLKHKARELGLKQCEFRGYAAPGDLLQSLLSSRVLIATQRPETTGLLWPSKLALLLDLPRPLVWIGNGKSAAALALRQRPDTGVFDPHETLKLVDWLDKLYHQTNSTHRQQYKAAGAGQNPKALWLKLIETGRASV